MMCCALPISAQQLAAAVNAVVLRVKFGGTLTDANGGMVMICVRRAGRSWPQAGPLFRRMT
jgi:hypothetical protein